MKSLTAILLASALSACSLQAQSNAAPAPVCDRILVSDGPLSMHVAPNPAGTYVEIAVLVDTPVELTLKDKNGKVVYKETFVDYADIPVSDLPRGAYALRLRSGDATVEKTLTLRASGVAGAK